MPATAAIIGFCTQEARVAIAGPDAGVAAKYGTGARVTPEPVETCLDSMDDVEVIADERLALLSADRRKFTIEVAGVETGLGLAYKPSTPAATLIDDQRMANMPVAIVEIGVDFETNKTVLPVWG